MMKLLLSAVTKLPLSVLYLLSDAGYYLIYYLIRYRREVVRNNLIHAFPAMPISQIIALEKKNYRFLCDNLIETLASPQMSEEELRSRYTFTNFELIEPYLNDQQSLQLLSIHQGNWEWLLQIYGSVLKAPLDAIYKPLHNSFFDTFFLSNRTRFGSRLVTTEKAIKTILKNRREYSVLSMMADQSPIRKETKYWSNFLNRPAPFYLGTQKVAELTQYPVFYFSIHRVKRGYYTVTFELIATPPFAKNSFDVIDGYIQAAERAIVAQPETWLWTNRKWRRKPEGNANDIFSANFVGEVKAS